MQIVKQTKTKHIYLCNLAQSVKCLWVWTNRNAW